MSKILDLYEANKANLGVDKISYDAQVAAKTPYSDDTNFNADQGALSDAKLKQGRGGVVNDKVKYSESMSKK